MTRFLGLDEVLELHRLLLEQSGGMAGVRDLGMLESAVAQPLMTFGGQELYPTIVEKAAAICYSLVMNHPFIDGNKRVGHAAMETFLVLNGKELSCPVAEQEKKILDLAAGRVKREDFTAWVRQHLVPLGTGTPPQETTSSADASAPLAECPDEINGLPVLCYTPIDSRHRHTRKTRHIVDGALIGPVVGLAICLETQNGESFFLSYCDENWKQITDGWHKTLEDAKHQGEFEYDGVSETWRYK